MLNRITLTGRLTRDPVLRQTQSGIPVVSFSLAVNRNFKDKATGETPVDFIDIVAWRHVGNFVARYFVKGQVAMVDGCFQICDWMDKGGTSAGGGSGCQRCLLQWLGQTCPERERPYFHYTNQLYRQTLERYGLRQSMMNSSGGRCNDTAHYESIWARIERNCFMARWIAEP